MSWKRSAWTGSFVFVAPSRDAADRPAAVLTVWAADLIALDIPANTEGGFVVETGGAFLTLPYVAAYRPTAVLTVWAADLTALDIPANTEGGFLVVETEGAFLTLPYVAAYRTAAVLTVWAADLTALDIPANTEGGFVVETRDAFLRTNWSLWIGLFGLVVGLEAEVLVLGWLFCVGTLV